MRAGKVFLSLIWGVFSVTVNPLSARIFTVFGHSLLEDRVLHKEAWVAKLLGTHLSIQVHKKVKFSWRDNSTLALKGLIRRYEIYYLSSFKSISNLCSTLCIITSGFHVHFVRVMIMRTWEASSLAFLRKFQDPVCAAILLLCWRWWDEIRFADVKR